MDITNLPPLNGQQISDGASAPVSAGLTRLASMEEAFIAFRQKYPTFDTTQFRDHMELLR